MKKLLLSLYVTVLLFSAASCDLYGPLRGTVGPGDFNVIASIFVYPGDSLTIVPGTRLYFRGNYMFTIGGYLYAAGTETDSIGFLYYPGTIRWNGIDFQDVADDNSVFEYCHVDGSDCVGLKLTSASPTVRHCTFSHCNAGGG